MIRRQSLYNRDPRAILKLATVALVMVMASGFLVAPAEAQTARVIDKIQGDPFSTLQWSEGTWTVNNNPFGCVTFPGGTFTDAGQQTRADSVACSPVANGWHWSVTIPGPYTLQYDFNGIPPGFMVCGQIFSVQGHPNIGTTADVKENWLICIDLDTGEVLWQGAFRDFHPQGMDGFNMLAATRCGRVRPLPMGACCYPDGTCEVTIQEECTPPAIWQGIDTDCDPNPCPQPTGACCFPDGHCEVLTMANCEADGGTYFGDGTDCDPNPCPPVPVDPKSWGQIKSHYR